MNKKKEHFIRDRRKSQAKCSYFYLTFLFFRKEDHLRYHPLLQELQAELEGMLQLHH